MGDCRKIVAHFIYSNMSSMTKLQNNRINGMMTVVEFPAVLEESRMNQL